jgi:ubiquitin-like modifier-activating enzyme 5
MLVQNTLKYLLQFGTVSRYLGYNSLKDFFPSMDIKPNPACTNGRCLDAQQAYQVGCNYNDGMVAVGHVSAVCSCNACSRTP